MQKLSYKFQVIKRTGGNVPYQETLILKAIDKAFLSENITNQETVKQLTEEVRYAIINTLLQLKTDVIHVEKIQDIVEDILMANGYHKIAKNFILYRDKHKVDRENKVKSQIEEQKLEIVINASETIIFNPDIIEEQLRQLTPDLKNISIIEMIESIIPKIYNRITEKELEHIILESARERIEKHYNYSELAARIALNNLYKKILHTPMNTPEFESQYRNQFKEYIQKGIGLELLNTELLSFDLDKIIKALTPERDKKFKFLGAQILIDRYLLKDREEVQTTFELPQWFWMRVAMGLSLKEKEKEETAISFYKILSKMDLVSSTPTLFNSGTNHSQMSSCYLNTVDDSLTGIFKLYGDCAQLSKWAGGIGTDWTKIRATGSKIKGTNGSSQGAIPFIKIFNDVALAVNQGGKRKGAMCAYMELWHLDFEQFIELKKNTGDERRRTHDINTAAWIPDLFMKRVQEDKEWTFFCPSDTPELHDLYGKKFEEKYCEYEAKNLPRSRKIKAVDLWRKMLTMLYETGHPWITFKDACNIRSPQDHCGVVHNSNLCTEITLNTSQDETAVCNLASINLANMITDGKIDQEKVINTVKIGIHMLDNVIDNNFYPTEEAKTANYKHRAIGLGIMGYQDALFQLNIPFNSEENLEFADTSTELISYAAIKASNALAKERGSYSSYKGSKWDRSIFPLDTLSLLEEERNTPIPTNRKSRLDWETLKKEVAENGMRNSNTMAIAPTATIANICGVYPCIEPVFKNIYMKENLSGNFIVINTYLIDDLEKINLWNDTILNKIKTYNGSIQEIEEIPEQLKKKYKETFEIDPEWIIKAAANRMKWIDQSASTNVFIHTKSGKLISDTYKLAWELGLKTTYYLRTLGASQVKKSTTISELNTDTDPEAEEENTEEARQETIVKEDVKVTQNEMTPLEAYVLQEPDCEACQ